MRQRGETRVALVEKFHAGLIDELGAFVDEREPAALGEEVKFAVEPRPEVEPVEFEREELCDELGAVSVEGAP